MKTSWVVLVLFYLIVCFAHSSLQQDFLSTCNVTNVLFTTPETIQQFLANVQTSMNTPQKSLTSIATDLNNVLQFVVNQTKNNYDVSKNTFKRLQQCPAFQGILDQAVRISANTTMYDTTLCPIPPIDPFTSKPVPEFSTDPCCDWTIQNKAFCSPRNVTYSHISIAKWNETQAVSFCQNRSDEARSYYQYYFKYVATTAGAICTSDMMIKRLETMASLKQAVACFELLYTVGQPCFSSSSDSSCFSGKCNYANSFCQTPSKDPFKKDKSLIRCLKQSVSQPVMDAMYLELSLDPNIDSEDLFTQKLYETISTPKCVKSDETIDNRYTNQASCESAGTIYCNDYSSIGTCSNINSEFCGVCNENGLCNTTTTVQNQLSTCTQSVGQCYRGHTQDGFQPFVSLQSSCTGSFCNAPQKLLSKLQLPCSSFFGFCIPFPIADNCIRAYSILPDGTFVCDATKNLYETPLGCVLPSGTLGACNTAAGDREVNPLIFSTNDCATATQRCKIGNIFYPRTSELCSKYGGQMVSVYSYVNFASLPSYFVNNGQVRNRTTTSTLKWRQVLDSSLFQSFLARAVSKAIFYPLYSSYIDCSLSPINDLATRVACTCQINSLYSNCSAPTQYTLDQNNVVTSVTSVAGTATISRRTIEQLAITAMASPIQFSAYDTSIILNQNTSINYNITAPSESIPISTVPLYNSLIPITVVRESLNPESWSGVTFSSNIYFVTDGKGNKVGQVTGAGLRISSSLILQNVVICGSITTTSVSDPSYVIPVFSKRLLNSAVADFRVASEVSRVYRDSTKNQICGTLSIVSSEMFYPSMMRMSDVITPSTSSLISYSSTIHFVASFHFLLLIVLYFVI